MIEIYYLGNAGQERGHLVTSDFAVLLSNECKCLCIRDFLLVYKPLSRPVVLIKTNWRLCLCDRKQYIVSQLSTTTLQNQNCL